MSLLPLLLPAVLLLAPSARAFEPRYVTNVSPYLVWSWGKAAPVEGKPDQVRWDLAPGEYRCGFVFQGALKDGRMAGQGVLRFHEESPCKGRRIEGELAELSDPIPAEAYAALAQAAPEKPETASGWRAKGWLYEGDRKAFEGVIENGEYVGDGAYLAPDGAVVVGPVQGWVFMPPVFQGTVSVKYADGRKESRFLPEPRLALAVSYGLLDEGKDNPMAVSTAARAQWALGWEARKDLEKKPGMFSKKQPALLYPRPPAASSCGLAAPFGKGGEDWTYEGECRDGLADGWGRMWKLSYSDGYYFGHFRAGAPRGRGVTNLGLDCVWEDFALKAGHDCSSPASHTQYRGKTVTRFEFLNYWDASIWDGRVYGGRPIVHLKDMDERKVGVLGGFWMPLGSQWPDGKKAWEGLVPAGHVVSYDALGESEGPVWVLWKTGPDSARFWDYEYVRTTWDKAYAEEMDFQGFRRQMHSLIATGKAWVAGQYMGSQAMFVKYGANKGFKALQTEVSKGLIAEEKFVEESRRRYQAEQEAAAREAESGLFGKAFRQASDSYYQGELKNLERMRADRAVKYRTYTGSENTQEGARRRDEALDRYFGR